MPSVVVDTTVLISGFITPEGVSAKLLERAQARAFMLCLSREIIGELRSRLLHRRKMRRRYHYADERVHQHCRDLEAAFRLITDLPQVRVVVRDPNDDVIIACALRARADYIVTRDNDLLSLGTYEGIRIVTPRQLLDLLKGWGTSERHERSPLGSGRRVGGSWGLPADGSTLPGG